MQRYNQRPKQQYNFNSTRIKIQGPTEYSVAEAQEALTERFTDRCILAPIMKSTPSGYHTFVTILKEAR